MKPFFAVALLTLMATNLQAQVWNNTGHIGQSLLSTDVSAASRVSASTYDESYTFTLSIECDPVDYRRQGAAFSAENTRFLLWVRAEEMGDPSTLYASFDSAAPLQVLDFAHETPVYAFKVDAGFWASMLASKSITLSSESGEFMAVFPLEDVEYAISNIRCLGEKP